MTGLTARWLFSGDAPPIENVRVEREGQRIATIETGVSIPAESRELAVIPALINTHTHLEFSDLREPVEPREDFPAWLRSVISSRHVRENSLEESIQQGLIESAQGGACGIGEIATSDWPFLDDLRGASQVTSNPRVRVYREILGLREEGIAEQLATAKSFLRKAKESGFVEYGLSPHAPYSVHPRLFDELCSLAEDASVPVAMHLAESPAELQLLRENDGPLRTLLEDMGLYREGLFSSGMRPLDYLKRLARTPRALVVHGNYLDREEIEFLAQHPQMSVAYCPRTHAAMQPDPHPWEEMESRGIRVTVGTDSRASNPDLSLWNELRFLANRHPDRPASTFLRWATSNAATAMGWDDLGLIAAGKSAELRVIRLKPEHAENPERGLFDGELHPIGR